MTILRPSQSAGTPEQEHKPRGFRSWPGNQMMQTLYSQSNAVLENKPAPALAWPSRRKLA